MNIAYNADCLEAMRKMPDNAFDLAVVDPPYGAGSTEGGGCKGCFEKYHQNNSQSVNVEREREREKPRHYTFGLRKKNRNYENRRLMVEEIRKKIIKWDTAPPKEYFEQLFRVSRNQIIWGGNYFGLPPTRCFLIWRKTNVPLEGFSMAAAEYAWTSFFENARVFEFSAINQPDRFHPTQKPVELYKWIYKRFAKDGDKILDTHLGSGSSRIAAYDLGFDFVGYEIDKEYFDKQEERFANHTAQIRWTV